MLRLGCRRGSVRRGNETMKVEAIYLKRERERVRYRACICMPAVDSLSGRAM